jgi:hypothetical protein
MLRQEYGEEEFSVKRLGLILSVLFILLICLCFANGTAKYAYVELIVKQSSGDGLSLLQVRGEFLESLMENDVRIAKALTVPEQWGRIDTWMVEHEAFNCPFSLDIENMMMECVNGYCRYSCGDEGYNIRIEDLRLQKTEEGWQVADWGEICESRGWGKLPKCY